MEEISGKPVSFRNWALLLYVETDSYNFNDVIFNINACKDYAYIKHLPEKEESKEHYHVILRFENAKTESALKKYLGIPDNYAFVEPIKNARSMCRYLTHIDYPEKIQYDISDVVVSRHFSRKFLLNFEDVKTEEEIILEIYNFLDKISFESKRDKLRMITSFVNINCYDTIFKRYKTEFLSYMSCSD